MARSPIEVIQKVLESRYDLTNVVDAQVIEDEDNPALVNAYHFKGTKRGIEVEMGADVADQGGYAIWVRDGHNEKLEWMFVEELSVQECLEALEVKK